MILSNLPSGTDWRDVKKFMSQAGEVSKVEVIQDTRSSKVSALVVYSSSLEAERALQQLDGLEFKGESVEVRENTGSSQLKSMRKSNQIYIKNLPYSVTWQQLRQVFIPFGEVVRVDIPKDINERSKGFGFIQFRTSLQAAKAISTMNNAEFNGRKILVKHAQKKHKKIMRAN